MIWREDFGCSSLQGSQAFQHTFQIVTLKYNIIIMLKYDNYYKFVCAKNIMWVYMLIKYINPFLK